MGRRLEIITEIAEQTNTTDQMHSKNGSGAYKLSAPTIRAAHQKITGKPSDWEKNRQDLLKELCEEISHEERKILRAESTPLSVKGLEAMRDALPRP